MSLSNFIKINQVSSLSDARYCAGMGVDILGFSMEPNQQAYVGPQQFKEITQWVSGPRLAGEFDDAEINHIKLATTEYDLDFIETTIPDHLEALSELQIPIILKQRLNSPDDFEKLKHITSFADGLYQYLHLVMNSDELSLLKSIEKEFQVPIIIQFKDPGKMFSQTSLGLSLSAHTEKETGLQDYGEIMDVLEALEIED